MVSMDRINAELKLKEIFNLDRLYDEQWAVIEKLFRGGRVLFIHRTGYGKSLCYQFPATQFNGVTVVFSPLIALMRDQINYLNSLGISARCINSNQTDEENRMILDEVINGAVKILYIAPERQENLAWLESVQRINLSMIVVDEAHCISQWGHDFRPAYRRIINLVKLWPSHLPVLATTATATARVAQDVRSQIGGEVDYLRGSLLRKNFHLRVVHVDSEDAKMAWLADFMGRQQETGIIYTGTRADTDIYARWLQHVGIPTVSYNAGIDAAVRKEIEAGLLENRWRCIVSTNALGMGIDKPDLRYIVHTQFPASPVHYYQEIGRAGRDGQPCYLVLLFNPADKSLIESFIETGRPPLPCYERVIEALQREPLSEQELVQKTNLKKQQVKVIKADLIEQEIAIEVIDKGRKKLEYRYGAPALDARSFEELRESKIKEMHDIINYAYLEECRMNYLCAYLGDQSVGGCGQCDHCLGMKIQCSLGEAWRQKIAEFRSSFFPVLEVKTQKSCLVDGVASSYYGFSNVGALIHKCKYEQGGDFPKYLVEQTLHAFRKCLDKEHYDLIVYVPPTESGDLVKNFAANIARALQIPVSHKLTKKQVTKPQKVFQNAALKKSNVKEVFDYEDEKEIAGKSILLIDDIFDSGATIKEIGNLFTRLGARRVTPLVIAKTVGGDLS